MKGISAVIATILMLMITIALAGTAYLYITGVFTSRTGVVLSLDAQSSSCGASNGNITVFIRNDGTTVATGLTLSFIGPNGATISMACYPNATTTPALAINAGSSASATCQGRTQGAGLYTISVSSGGSSASGSQYCAS